MNCAHDGGLSFNLGDKFPVCNKCGVHANHWRTDSYAPITSTVPVPVPITTVNASYQKDCKKPARTIPRSACYDVPEHHKNIWDEFATNTAPDEVKRVGELGEKKAHGFKDQFLNELHHRMYSEEPRKVEQKDLSASIRSKLHEMISDLPETESLRAHTVRNPLWAGMATMALAESVSSVMPDFNGPDAEEILNDLNAIREMKKEFGSTIELDKIEKATTNASYAAVHSTAKAASGLDESKLREALRNGIASAESQIETAEESMSALGCGNGPGSARSISPGTALQIAKKVASSPKLKAIMDLAGKLTLTARSKRATKNKYARSEIVGVEQTKSLARVLPIEMMGLSSKIGTANLYRKTIEGSALGYKMEGKERESRGPIIIAIDQSGSMNGRPDQWAKAVALAILDTATREKRGFGVILYDSTVRYTYFMPKPEQSNPIELLNLLSSFSAGGTEFAPPMMQALKWIRDVDYAKKADIIHITDGAGGVSGSTEFKEACKFLDTHVYGISIGPTLDCLKAWSHQTTAIDDVSNDSKAVDLIFDNV